MKNKHILLVTIKDIRFYTTPRLGFQIIQKPRSWPSILDEILVGTFFFGIGFYNGNLENPQTKCHFHRQTYFFLHGIQTLTCQARIELIIWSVPRLDFE